MQIVNSYEVVKGDIRRKLEDIKGVLASTDIDEKIKDTKIVMETLPEEILSKIFSQNEYIRNIEQIAIILLLLSITFL